MGYVAMSRRESLSATVVQKIVHPIREAGLDPFKVKLRKLLENGEGAFAATSSTDEGY